MKSIVLLLFGFFVLVRSQEISPYDEISPNGEVPEECRSCNPEECNEPVGCLAGIVKDGCGCCDVCGKVEFELCDHPGVPRPKSAPYYGNCGDNLECRLRTDLEKNEGPEAICYCRLEDALCGSDNVTYDNICQLRAADLAKETKIYTARKGPCNSAPIIVSPPEHTKNITGSNIAILCEAKGFPVPNIEWTWTRVDGQTVYLPSDDLHISVNMRGGPEKWHITGWLQIIDLKKQHEGDYTCIAQNDHGIAQASARVNVVDDHGKDRRF